MDERLSQVLQLVQVTAQFLTEMPWGQIAGTLLLACIVTRLFSGVTSYTTRRPLGEEKPWTARLLPFWLPYMGHALSFGLWRQRLLGNVKGSTSEPLFALQLCGRRHNIITSRSMARALLSKRSHISSEPCIDYVMENVFGARKEVRKCRHQALGSLNFIAQEPHASNLCSSFVRAIEQSIPDLVTFSPSMVDQVSWERLSDVTVNDELNPSACDVNFYALIKYYIGSITATTLMGRAFVDTFPNVLSDMWTFNSRFNPMLMGIPRFVPFPGLVPAYGARKRLIRTLTAFQNAFAATEAGIDPGFDLRDLDDVSELIQDRSRARIKNGVDSKTAASEDIFTLWSVSIKLSALVFWNIINILADDDLHVAVLKEISPHARASRPDSQAAGFHIQEPPRLALDMNGLLSECPLFRATFYETLRLHTLSFTYRKVTSPFTICESEDDAKLAGRPRRSYQFRKGEYVGVPQTSRSQEAFGARGQRITHDPYMEAKKVGAGLSMASLLQEAALWYS